jgi:hypothetical protein
MSGFLKTASPASSPPKKGAAMAILSEHEVQQLSELALDGSIIVDLTETCLKQMERLRYLHAWLLQDRSLGAAIAVEEVFMRWEREDADKKMSNDEKTKTETA